MSLSVLVSFLCHLISVHEAQLLKLRHTMDGMYFKGKRYASFEAPQQYVQRMNVFDKFVPL